jgi:uncharacterized protein YqeY
MTTRDPLYNVINSMNPSDQKLIQEYLEETLPIYEFKSEVTEAITPIGVQINQEKIIGKVRRMLCLLRNWDSL